MRFALFGSDEDALALAQTVRASSEHELTARYEISEKGGAAGVIESLEAPRGAESWEAALLETVADAVIVGWAATPDQFEEPLRRLTQEAMPALVVHPACSSLLALELEMIRSDTGALLLPYLPAAGHPAVQQLVHWSRDAASPLGAVTQLVIERHLVRGDSAKVMRELARDADLMRMLLGEVDKVSALRGDDAGLANLSVQVTSAAGVLARWSVAPAQGSASGRVVVIGQQGRATLEMHEAPANWELRLNDARYDLAGLAEWDSAASAVKELTAAVAGKPPRYDWADACRSLEITEAVERSLKKGKTIELFHEQPTEEATFKSMMAAGGCLLLMLSLLVLVLVGLLTDGLGLPIAAGGYIQRFWPVLLAAPLVVFTALQLLRFVFPSEASTSSDSTAKPDKGARGDVEDSDG